MRVTSVFSSIFGLQTSKPGFESSTTVIPIMDIDDDDAFLYGAQSPPPTSDPPAPLLAGPFLPPISSTSRTDI